MKKEVLPQIIRDVGFDFHRDVEKVWQLDYPVEEIDIDVLAWHFAIPFWNTKDGLYNLSPNEVMTQHNLKKSMKER